MHVALPHPDFGPVRIPRLAVALLAVALGDWLFYGHAIGLSLPLFMLALGVGVLAANVVRAPGRQVGAAFALLLVGVLPLVEAPGALGFLFGATALALVAILVTEARTRSVGARCRSVAGLLFAGPFRLVPDAVRSVLGWRTFHVSLAGAVGWAVPVLFGGVFLYLFTTANPLIESWIPVIQPEALVSRIDGWRVAAWFLLLSLAWAAIAVRPPREATTPLRGTLAAAAAPEREAGHWFDAAAIRRSLVLINLAFGLQSLLDLTYLWGGVALPDGMSYATYAHRGTYALIVAAVLAGGFAVAAVRPDREAESGPAIRALTLGLLGQTMLLVVSAALRLDLYVAAYSLTLLRAAAFAGMLLVGIGLALVSARIVLRRSGTWLVGANALALAGLLYAAALTDVSALVADYNVAHSREIAGVGQLFDLRYAECLGPSAIPAVDRFLAVRPNAEGGRDWRARSAAWARTENAAWRGWSFRRWRLVRYLDDQPPRSDGAGDRDLAPR